MPDADPILTLVRRASEARGLNPNSLAVLCGEASDSSLARRLQEWFAGRSPRGISTPQLARILAALSLEIQAKTRNPKKTSDSC